MRANLFNLFYGTVKLVSSHTIVTVDNLVGVSSNLAVSLCVYV